ncbi:hypothetical protein FI667_g1897, partial [Globisporangium splendens]
MPDVGRQKKLSHIVWSCKRAQAAWTASLGRWMGGTLTEQALNLFLPHIASRTAPPGQRSLIRELEKRFGFITPEHSAALQKLWFIVTSSIPVLLWRTRVEIVHEQQHVAIEESTKRVWTACVFQVRVVAHRMRTLKGEKINATCLSQLLSVLERQDLSRQLEAWATARLYFDGGARGNPGPGGSGWALIFLNERSNRWELKACGYAYMGPEVTNTRQVGSLRRQPNDYRSPEQVLLNTPDQVAATSSSGKSNHRQLYVDLLESQKREQNKMADLLANMAMDPKNARILTVESRGDDQVLLSQVAALLDNDIVCNYESEESIMALSALQHRLDSILRCLEHECDLRTRLEADLDRERGARTRIEADLASLNDAHHEALRQALIQLNREHRRDICGRIDRVLDANAQISNQLTDLQRVANYREFRGFIDEAIRAFNELPSLLAANDWSRLVLEERIDDEFVDLIPDDDEEKLDIEI